MISILFLFTTINALSFNEWKSLHNKKYNAAENLRRQFIFKTNSKYVETKNKELSYKLSMKGPFSAMTQEEFKSMYNPIKHSDNNVISLEEFEKENEDKMKEIDEMKNDNNLQNIQNLQNNENDKINENIKKSENNKIDKNIKQASYGSYIDYRNRLGKNQVTPVGDQGSCDSGYVFAASSLIESKMLITYSSLSASTYKVSKGELLSCTKGYNGSNNNGCHGGSVEALLQYVKDKSVGAESEFGYTTYDGNTSKCSSIIKIAKVKSFKTVETKDSTNSILISLSSYGPVVAYLDAMDLQFYDSGILKGSLCSSTETTQSVLIVGYGVDGTTDYWVCKNSYGSSWGEDGYFRIVGTGNNCGLTKQITCLTSVSKV